LKCSSNNKIFFIISNGNFENIKCIVEIFILPIIDLLLLSFFYKKRKTKNKKQKEKEKQRKTKRQI
jgi:uncharacterized membrane protein